jgi:hypothetical protein
MIQKHCHDVKIRKVRHDGKTDRIIRDYGIVAVAW